MDDSAPAIAEGTGIANAPFATLDVASPAGRARSSEPSAACRIIRADVPRAPKEELNPAVRDRGFSHRPHECGAEQVHRILDQGPFRQSAGDKSTALISTLSGERAEAPPKPKQAKST